MFDELTYEIKDRIEEASGRFKLLAGVVVAGLLALAGAWVWSAREKRPAPPTEVTAKAREARARGDYELVFSLVERGLAAKSDAPEWEAFRKEFETDLKVGLRMEYFPQQRGRPVAAQGDLKLSVADRPYFLVTPSAPCHLYLFWIKSNGELEQLFPNSNYSQASNPVPPGKQKIPSGSNWLTLESRSGTERIFLVAAAWPIPELEQLAKQAAAEKDSKRREGITGRLLARLAIEEKFTDRLPGLVYGSGSWVNTGSAAAE